MTKKITIISLTTILVLATAAAGFWLLKNGFEQNNDKPEQSDGPGQVQTISGTITRIDMDCQKARYLNKDGEAVVSEGPAICDSGNSIEIDDTHSVYTSSGFTGPEHAFDKHNKDWGLGDKVSLTVLENESGNYTLNCDTCGEN